MKRLSVVAFLSTHSRFTISLNHRIMILGDLMSLGSRIRTKRKALGLSQQALAQQLNISHKTLSKWENDTHVPDLDMITKLAIYFGVTLDELIDGKVPKTQLETIQSDADFIETLILKIKKVNVLILILIFVYGFFYVFGTTLENCQIRYQVMTISLWLLILNGLVGFFYNKRHWLIIQRYRLLKLIQHYENSPRLVVPLDSKWLTFQQDTFTIKSRDVTLRYDQVKFQKIDLTYHWFGYRVYLYFKHESELFVLPLDQKSYPLFKYKINESEGYKHG